MKNYVTGVLISVIMLIIIIPMQSCSSDSSAPSDKSWDNPEEFVLYDVTKYINTALENNQEMLEKEYGSKLAEAGLAIWNFYSTTGKKPVILDVERFADGCWVTVTGTFAGIKGDAVYDISTFYYRFHNDRWQIAHIKTQGYDKKGLEISGTEIEYERDIEYK